LGNCTKRFRRRPPTGRKILHKNLHSAVQVLGDSIVLPRGTRIVVREATACKITMRSFELFSGARNQRSGPVSKRAELLYMAPSSTWDVEHSQALQKKLEWKRKKGLQRN
jgi:hypothetical protein